MLNHLCKQYTVVYTCSVVWRRWEGKNTKGNMLVVRTWTFSDETIFCMLCAFCFAVYIVYIMDK